MNQLQLFAATTEWLRADILRCLRKLRLLDRRLQETTAAMRGLVTRVAHERLTIQPHHSSRKRPRSGETPDELSSSKRQTIDALVEAYHEQRRRMLHHSALRLLVAGELVSNAEDLNRMIAMRNLHFSRSLRQQAG
jgi:hypothetical protein